MLSATHTIISLPLGILFENPLLAAASALLAHFAADRLLHWNIYPQDYARFPYGLVAVDVFGGLAAAALLLGDSILSPPVLAAVLGGNLPDILHALWIISGGERRPERWPAAFQSLFAFHHRIQRETRQVAKGLLWQVALAAPAAAAALWLQ
ncbi:MAG: hypothetical protein HY372_02625 [Candidatus Andersenbacteria bacterium]|nr:hypothetical protein [Candidatus Andersenbacteria bacterium]